MNQSPSIANSINTYNPQSFSSSGLNGPTSNIQNNSLNSSINNQSNENGISISTNSIYSGTLESVPKANNNKYSLTPIIFVLIVFMLALILFVKFFKDSKKSFK